MNLLRLVSATGSRGCCRFKASIASSGNKLKYSVTETVPYCPDKFLNVVKNVQDYDKFIPLCNKSTIQPYKPRRQTSTTASGQLVALGTLHIGFDMPGFGSITEKYTSRVTLSPDSRQITAENLDGTIFKEMRSKWTFGETDTPNTCKFHFEIDYTMSNQGYALVAKQLFPEISKRMVESFKNEVKRQSQN